MDENQIILIDKPAGISSFGVVAKVRSRLKTEFGHKVKVGHTGTLDPFATGLLIILTGKNTKRSNEFLKLDKIYEATLKLGYISSTGDPEGQILKYHQVTKFTKVKECEEEVQKYSKEGSEESVGDYDQASEESSPLGEGARAPSPKRKAVELVLQSFIGKIQQTPPRFSAIKINGQRAYKLARQNKDFEIPSREIEIYSINILDYHYPELTIEVHCSSGTYIRTLAEDIGKSLGTGAYLTALRRIQVGKYHVKDANML